MASKNIIGVFSSQNDADGAVSELMDLGYTPEQISFVMKQQEKTKEETTGMAQNVTGSAISGATKAGVVAGLAGLLVGLGALSIPGIGALFIGGPLAAALGLTGAAATAVSAATTGVVAGGIVGGLVGLGLPEETARVYEQHLKEGGVILAVPVEARAGMEESEVQAVFAKHDVQQVKTI